MARREETEAERARRIAILNARLPKKRNIAQGLLRNPAGDVLLCELSYKKEWDLPGGCRRPGRAARRAPSPGRSTRSSGWRWSVGPLVAVNWLPPWRGWDDAHLFLFDLGVFEGELDPARFLRREIAGAHWVAPASGPLSTSRHTRPACSRPVADVPPRA